MLETTSEVLEELGYKVLQAKDGVEAAEIFKQHQDVIDLVILDVVMPNCGAVQTAKQIRGFNLSTCQPDVHPEYN